MPYRRAWQPTLVFLPAKSHGQRSLVGYSPWGHKESDMTEQLILDTSKELFIGRAGAEAETPILWRPDMKNQLVGKDPEDGKY